MAATNLDRAIGTLSALPLAPAPLPLTVLSRNLQATRASPSRLRGIRGTSCSMPSVCVPSPPLARPNLLRLTFPTLSHPACCSQIGAKKDELQFTFEDDANWHPYVQAEPPLELVPTTFDSQIPHLPARPRSQGQQPFHCQLCAGQGCRRAQPGPPAARPESRRPRRAEYRDLGRAAQREHRGLADQEALRRRQGHGQGSHRRRCR